MGLLTPYVVVDTKAFMQHLSIVKHFVSMKKFIVLIPSEGEFINLFYELLLFVMM